MFPAPVARRLRKYVCVISLAVLPFSVTACGEAKWKGFVYVDREDFDTPQLFIGEFESLEACRDACRAKLEELNALSSGDYECGKDCVFISQFRRRVCEEATR